MKNKTATEILEDRIRDRRDLQEAVLRERLNIECALFVYEARKKAKLSQKKLGALVGTSQAAIARIEDADYGIRTIEMMVRIAGALGYEVKIEFQAITDPDVQDCEETVDEKVSSPDVNLDPTANNNFAFAA